MYWRMVFRANFPLALLACMAYALAHILVDNPRSTLDARVASHLPNLMPIAALFVVCALGFVALRASLNNDPNVGRSERLLNWLKTVPWLEMVLIRFAFGFFILDMNKFSFSVYKPAITEFVPFSWDYALTGFDQFLLFGYHGWEVTHALFPTAYASFVIDKLYLIWFLVVVTFYMFAIIQPLYDWRRLAVLLTLMLSWLVSGGVMATIFSSAGPVFFKDLYGDPMFQPLMDRLHAHSLQTAPEFGFSVLNVSDLLWRGYIGQEGYGFLGISAFPSMHVSLMAVMWLFARTYGRVWGGLAFAYLVVILIGSVHLGWHYMVDGLAAIVMAWITWSMCAWFAKRWMEPFSPVGDSVRS